MPTVRMGVVTDIHLNKLREEKVSDRIVGKIATKIEEIMLNDYNESAILKKRMCAQIKKRVNREIERINALQLKKDKKHYQDRRARTQSHLLALFLQRLVRQVPHYDLSGYGFFPVSLRKIHPH